MHEPGIAETQCNDLVGSIAIDGHQGSPIGELAARAGVPDSYLPVGLQLYSDSSLQLAVLAVDRSTLPGGRLSQDYIDVIEELPVFKFPVEVTFQELWRLVNRLHIVAANKSLKDKRLRILIPPDDLPLP